MYKSSTVYAPGISLKITITVRLQDFPASSYFNIYCKPCENKHQQARNWNSTKLICLHSMPAIHSPNNSATISSSKSLLQSYTWKGWSNKTRFSVNILHTPSISHPRFNTIHPKALSHRIRLICSQ